MKKDIDSSDIISEGTLHEILLDIKYRLDHIEDMEADNRSFIVKLIKQSNSVVKFLANLDIEPIENPFEEARDVLLEIQDDLRELSFDDEFILNVNDYLTPESDLLGQMLPPTPDVNPALMSQVMPSSNVMETGLTPTEQALLSDEEKGIKLRQRGMTT